MREESEQNELCIGTAYMRVFSKFVICTNCSTRTGGRCYRVISADYYLRLMQSFSGCFFYCVDENCIQFRLLAFVSQSFNLVAISSTLVPIGKKYDIIKSGGPIQDVKSHSSIREIEVTGEEFTAHRSASPVISNKRSRSHDVPKERRGAQCWSGSHVNVQMSTNWGFVKSDRCLTSFSMPVARRCSRT